MLGEEKENTRGALMDVGDDVIRMIEGVGFLAIVTSMDIRRRRCSVKYCDDGNVEDMVPWEELRPAADSSSSSQARTGAAVRDTLAKPLMGLVEDDSASRSSHRPTVTVHRDTNTDEAIIINGASHQLATGGGLRALRYLKN
jgi:hypothetical protein